MNIEECDLIKNNPHLFHITTPVKIGCFSDLLSTYPNRLLVESTCEGLKTSFWPWAITAGSNPPQVVDNAPL